MFHKRHFKIITAALLVLAVALSGCINAELDTKVNKDFSGTRTMHLEMAPIVHAALESNLSRESLSSVQGAEIVSYKKDIKNDKVIMDIVMKYKDLRNVKGVRISEHDKLLRYEDSSFESMSETGAASMSGAISIKYTVEMPYKIENSNADTIEENRATWVITGSMPKTLYAESRIPAIPGFTVMNFLIAGLVLMIIFRVRNIRR